MERKRSGLIYPANTGLQKAFVLLLQYMHFAASHLFRHDVAGQPSVGLVLWVSVVSSRMAGWSH